MGLCLFLQGKSSPVFIHLPQNKSLSIISNGRSMCMAMHSCAQTQPQSLSRGSHNHIFTEDNNKYYCVGAQPGRAERGVHSGLYKMKYSFLSSEWDSIHKVLKCAEYAFNMFMDTNVIQHIVDVRQFINLRKMEQSLSSIHAKAARYYNGGGFGINVFLRCHVDRDFTISIVQVHIWIKFHISVMIMLYAIFISRGSELLLHSDRETFYCSMHRNHTVYLCTAIKMKICISFHFI
jgi:hypothetical protein